MTYQKKIGDLGEKIAADYLQRKGYELLDQHYITRYGELDLVMSDAGSIVFIEVKTRTSVNFGMPEISITPEKIEKVQNAALLWLQAHPDAPDDCRIEALAIVLDQHSQVRDIHHFLNVI